MKWQGNNNDERTEIQCTLYSPLAPKRRKGWSYFWAKFPLLWAPCAFLLSNISLKLLSHGASWGFLSVNITPCSPGNTLSQITFPFVHTSSLSLSVFSSFFFFFSTFSTFGIFINPLTTPFIYQSESEKAANVFFSYCFTPSCKSVSLKYV